MTIRDKSQEDFVQDNLGVKEYKTISARFLRISKFLAKVPCSFGHSHL